MKKIVLSLIVLISMQLAAQEKLGSTVNDKIGSNYLNASISEKLVLNKKYDAEVLPILTSYETSVDDKFLGVKNFGNQLIPTTKSVFK
jgi:hypothetical protein